MDVQRTCLLIDVSSGAQKITGSGFMDVQKTCLLIDVSSGAQKITGSGFMDVQRSGMSHSALKRETITGNRYPLATLCGYADRHDYQRQNCQHKSLYPSEFRRWNKTRCAVEFELYER
jgi:hypothetical protein